MEDDDFVDDNILRETASFLKKILKQVELKNQSFFDYHIFLTIYLRQLISYSRVNTQTFLILPQLSRPFYRTLGWAEISSKQTGRKDRCHQLYLFAFWIGVNRWKMWLKSSSTFLNVLIILTPTTHGSLKNYFQAIKSLLTTREERPIWQWHDWKIHGMMFWKTLTIHTNQDAKFVNKKEGVVRDQQITIPGLRQFLNDKMTVALK